jgi:hypothetical protein
MFERSEARYELLILQQETQKGAVRMCIRIFDECVKPDTVSKDELKLMEKLTFHLPSITTHWLYPSDPLAPRSHIHVSH